MLDYMIFVSAPHIWVILFCIRASFGKWYLATLIIQLGRLHLLSGEAPLGLNIDPWVLVVKKAPLGIIIAPLGLPDFQFSVTEGHRGLNPILIFVSWRRLIFVGIQPHPG